MLAGACALPVRAQTAPTVLYEAQWTHGLSGWQPAGDSGWSVTSSIAAFDNHSGAADLIAPYRLANLRDFAVEAQIERIGGDGYNLAYAEHGYGIFVRGTGNKGASVEGGFLFGQINGNGYLPQSALDWGGSVLRGADVALHDGFNTFRLEVHGNHYAVYENGVLTIQATVSGFAGDRVGIFSREYRIRVRSFRVIALPARSVSGGLSPSLLGRLPGLDLQQKKVPAGFGKNFGEYYTNSEIATERGVTVDSLKQAGRLLSYQVEYRQLLDRRHPNKGEKAIDSTVAAFSSATSARTDFDTIRAAYSGSQYRVSTPGKYGTEDFLAVYDQMFDGKLNTSYDLVFVRGQYRAAVSVSFVKGKVPAFQALQWLHTAAQAVDTRLKGAASP
jgi:hypothetical protein